MAGTTTELADFLTKINLPQMYDRLVAEDIDMSVLPLLDESDLKELGLSLGQRKKLLTALKGLKTEPADAVAVPDAPETNNPVQLRRLSVLFCDMVGSTELGEMLDIDGMEAVLQHYYDIANTVARRHNGHIATSQGDGLVILFGYPRVLDGFAERSLLAAKDLQDTLSKTPVKIEGHSPINIFTRIGIATGQAAVGQKQNDMTGDHMHLVGPVVNRAARLQTIAHPQSCAVDAKTRELTASSVIYSEPERHRLKGLSEPVQVFHVHGMRQTTETSGASVVLVGRDAEVATIGSLWADAQQGHATALTISGDAGIGKSTLIQNFLAAQSASSTRVIRMLCTSMASQSPLRPVANALTDLTGASDDADALASLLNHSQPEVIQRAKQFLEIANQPNDESAISGDERQDILDLLTEWLIGPSDCSTIVVLENAQWADDSTRQLMHRALKHGTTEGAHLFMIAVTREEQQEFWPESLHAPALALGPLDQPGSAQLLDSLVAGTPIAQSVRDNILYHADGNPLMLTTLGHAHVQNSLPEVADAIVVPHTIYESVSKRLDTIQSGRGVIEALAVIGAPVSTEVLRAVVPAHVEDLSPALEALERAGLIEKRSEGGKDHISIRHKVYRDVIYEQIEGKSRRKLHLATYKALTTFQDLRPEILANHAQAANDWDNASTHALVAADGFLKRSALIEAGHFFDIANNALKRRPVTPDTLRNRLRAVSGMASVERSRFGIATDRSAELGQQMVELARDVGDETAEFLALNGLYSHALVRANYPKAQEHAEALLENAQRSQNRTFIMIGTRATGAVALHLGNQTKAVERFTDAFDRYDRDTHLHLAHAHGYDHAEICSAMLSMSLWISGDLERAKHFSAFSINHSREINHAHSLTQAISFRVVLGALARHGDELFEVGAECMQVAEKYGIHVMYAAAHLFPFATHLCLRSHPPSPAEMTDLEARVKAFRAVNPFNYGPLLADILSEVYLRAGDHDAADAMLKDALNIASKTGEIWTSPAVIRTQARVAEARGDTLSALRLRDEALSLAHDLEARTITLRIRCDAAEADPSETTLAAVKDALSGLISRDDGWDIRRAEALLQGAAAS